MNEDKQTEKNKLESCSPSGAAPCSVNLNKEDVYDKDISPLVKNIIAICQEHGIEMMVNFHIQTKENPDLQVLTALPDESGVLSDVTSKARRFILNY